jgi:hypothetical protein
MSGWADRIAAFGSTQELLSLLGGPSDPQAALEAERLFWMALGSGWLTAFADPDYPDFVPAVSTHLHCVGTNPDFVYAVASIDGHGSYLLSGERGESLFVLMDIAAGGLGVMDMPGPSLGTIDFDELALDQRGRFSLLLSAERPLDWAGDWRRLDPAAKTLTLRQASYDWGEEREARVAIDRVDRPHRPRRRAAEDIAARLSALAAYPRRLSGMALGFMAAQREKGLWNRLEHDDWAGQGGVQGQHYYQGLFRLEPGQAILLESELPKRVRYWNVQLSDALWNSVDWVNHQSSLNGGQARIDSDGRLRAVISLADPGVPNWLDPGGHGEGLVMFRWTDASDGPQPELRAIDIENLRTQLPADTPVVSAEERQIALRARRRGAQLRRRW